MPALSDEGFSVDPRLAEAMLHALFNEAALPITFRSHDGSIRLIGSSGTWGRPQFEEAVGHFTSDGLSFFDANGRPLSRLEHPAHVARTTGQPQPNYLLGIRGAGGEEVWIRFNYIPVSRGAEGWSVLAVGSDVTELHVAQREAKQRIAGLEALLTLSEATRHAVTPEEAAAGMRPLATALFDNCNLTLAILRGQQLTMVPAQLSESMDPGPDVVPLIGPTLEHWSAGTQVNQRVQDTDIYAHTVVGSLEIPFRSIAQVPLLNRSGVRFGTIASSSTLADFYTPARIEALERAAAMIGPRLDLPGRAAAA